MATVSDAASSTDHTVSGLLAEAVHTRPDAIALVSHDEHVSLQELVARAHRVAGTLARAGCSTDTVIATYLGRSIDLVVLVLGIVEAGAAFVALDPAYPSERVRVIATEAKPALIIARTVDIDWAPCPVWTVAQAADGPLTPERTVRAGLEAALAIVYTSGSTGTPKGVIITHRVVLNRLLWTWRCLDLSSRDVALLHRSTTLVSFATELLAPLLVGARLIVASDADASDPRRFWALLVTHRVTQLRETPAASRPLLEFGEATRPSSALCTLFIAGEPARGELFARWRGIVPGLRVLTGYGLTECSVAAWHDASDAGLADETVPVGVHADRVDIYLLDDGLSRVAAGMVGEIYLAGESTARGYLHAPRPNAERFVANPFAAVAGTVMFRTGDLGVFDERDRLFFEGRRDSQTKVRGFRVEIGDVEAALQRCAGVCVAAVVARPTRAGDTVLVAYLQLADGSRSAQPIVHELRGRLPGHMLPSEFVVVERMPLSPSGKVDRQRLGGSAAAAAPPPAPSLTDTEAHLSGMFTEMLEVETVDPDCDFLDAGGHSLAAMRIVSRLQDHFGLRIAASDLLEGMTLRELAARIDRETA
jgi:amino acid adenylation domain-containing protein